ncbi:MAG TPA: alpha-amylase/4-alpha-glucanotransferase domain-containing protein [Candidatus Limnocylindrales bacterium]|nr:alpha-amylase/4-alpha-glucanotransferase domain-containing protein [Candidatus Limnocylindrales bacterium]
MPKFQLVLLIHAHQPVGNFEDVLAKAYEASYFPFLEVLARHPSIRIGLHYSGSLLEWIERAHPEYFDRVRELAGRGQVEIIGGGFYEPILIAIPMEDRLAQITRLADYIEHHFGARPRGAWVAERVWEPQLPSTLAPARVEYTLVDDNHFLGAGFELEKLFGYFTAEDGGQTVKVLPGLKALRYLIPFREPNETSQFLRRAAAEHRGSFATMGDDLEKFGVWPGTHKHCYTDGWLERFFSELDKNSDWLETSTPADAIQSHAPLGRADLPTASYTEMMEWALPTPARNRFHILCEEFASRPESLPFLRGATWRNFFTKYCESNLLQKKMLHVSAKVRRMAATPRREKSARAACAEAQTLLLRSQCNDAYWHGIFGGLYSPHLRTALWNSLIRAETIADSLQHRGRAFAATEKIDFTAAGNEEIYFTCDRYAALVQPEDGATIPALDCRTSGTALINSLARRRESYHDRLKNAPPKITPGVKSIHDQVRVKEEGLERWLNYDRWPRHAFRVLLFGPEKNYQDYAAVRLDENAAVAAGRYRVVDSSKTHVAMASEESADWPAEKSIEFAQSPAGFSVACETTIRRTAPGSASVLIGIEAIVNFLAPSAPDRYFESAGQRFPLRWAAAVPASGLRVVDEWQRVAVTLAAPGARDFWIAPIETVSESEDGFERIYQGSQILAVWPVELAPGGEWEGRLEMRVEGLP